MGPEFITRIIRTTAVLSIIVALCCCYYFDWKFGVGILTGVAWSLLNLYFLRQLILEVITPGETRRSVVVGIMLLKFPLLYITGYLVIASDYFTIYSLMLGFTLMFIVTILKVFGRILLGMDNFSFLRKPTEGTR